MNKRTKAATESLAFIGIAAGILVALNVLSVGLFARVDVTEKRLFSLSEGSKRLVKDLDDSLEVSAYFTQDLPPPFNATERYVRDLLAEYEAASGGKMHVRFVHPDDDETKKQAEDDGVMKVAHQVLGEGKVDIMEGYRGVVFKYLGEKKTLATIDKTEGLEYAITQTLKELSGEKTKVGVLKGHPGPTLAQGLSVLKAFLPTYELVEVEAKSPIDKGLKALLIVSPEDALTDDELLNIDAFVMNGGSLGVFGGSIKVAQEAGLSASPIDSGLNKLLSAWGVKLGSGVVADAQCGQAPLRTQLGFSMPVPFPPVPIASFTEEQAKHPATFRLNQVFLPFGSNLELTSALTGDKDAKVSVLAKSSDRSWLLSGDTIDLSVRNPREWTMGEPHGPFNLIVSIEGKLPSAFAPQAVSTDASPLRSKGPSRATKAVHVIVAGASGFLRDEFLPKPEQVDPAELNSSIAFGLNAIDWLAQEDALIAIRAKNVEDPLIKVPHTVQEAEDAAKTAATSANEEAQQKAKSGDIGAAQATLEKGKADVEVAMAKRKDALDDWDAKKMRYRIANTIAMPFLLILFGVGRWRWRQRKRATLTI